MPDGSQVFRVFSEIAKAFYLLHADSDEKYEEFQVDSQLRYTCASCRDECYKVHPLSACHVNL